MRPAATTLLAALFVVLVAGCVGPGTGVGGTPTASPTDMPTPTPTASPEPVTTTVPDPTDGNTVDYANLSADAKAAFDAARDGEARFLPDSPHVEGDYFDPTALDEFRDHEYVERNGTTYALSIHSGELYASYTIYADPASPGENASVVAHENLSANVSAQVRSAVENGSHDVPLGKWQSLHPDLADVEYVRYGGDTYRLSYAVGDYWVQVLTAEPTV